MDVYIVFSIIFIKFPRNIKFNGQKSKILNISWKIIIIKSSLGCTSYPPIAIPEGHLPMDIDSKDQRIIEALRQNSRAPVREISKITKIRPSTVHQRVQKLVKNKVIERFTVKLNNKAVGENFIVFVLVKGSMKEYIGKNLVEASHIKEIFGVTGEYDLLLKLKFRDVEEFNSFILDLRKDKRDIQSTMTMVATANIKEEL